MTTRDREIDNLKSRARRYQSQAAKWRDRATAAEAEMRAARKRTPPHNGPVMLFGAASLAGETVWHDGKVIVETTERRLRERMTSLGVTRKHYRIVRWRVVGAW